MKMFKFISPRGLSEMTISMPYGSFEIKNGQMMPESDLTRSYPGYFIEMPKDVKVKPTIEKKEVSILLESVETPVKTETEEKRKPGRPKRTF